MGFLHPKMCQAHQVLADFASTAIRRAWEAGSLHEDTSYRRVLLSLLPFSAKRFHAIRVLCDEGYGEDMLVLARSLVNITIDLGFISNKDREQRATQWLWFYPIVASDELRRHPTPDDLPNSFEVTVARDEVLRRHPEYPKNTKRGWSGWTIKARAEQSGLDPKWYNFVYWDLSSVEHSDVFGTRTYLLRPGDEGWERYVTPPSLASVYQKAMEVSLEMYSHVLSITLRGLGLSEVEELPGVLERSRQLYAEAEKEM